jgi:hypothetical protein
LLGLLATLAACGRIWFDPHGTGGDDTSGIRDGATGSDGNGSGTIDAPVDTPIDALPALCANAMPASVGTAAGVSTCAGQDVVDLCSPNKQEVVFRFVPPATAGYTIRAFDAGTQNVSNSTNRYDASCTMRIGGCTGIIGTALTAGQPIYFVVEASQAACATIDFEIVQN